ncbi:Prolipoprotein diacylglyceryl transferase [Abditibacterium utsteinense]|uniref:Phosphatidylglycerol--prolipoprotein diacylglyceryl transferase n=1 Tax=Abditibacterium utsteinense TaxID=1960156 RepID=A0A2S8SPH4_9BACT|nr:prolipoprotein diacylglyceryl transferase [Abditibacterium utsteinense]PQV62691.1 Prolipoprotein diacylglyceryl transferase [Abditibacterium utsteinense]
MTPIWTHNLSPFLLSFQWNGQTVGLRWYGLAYVASFALGYWMLRRAVWRGEITHLSERALEHLVGALVLGVVVGGRLGYVMQNLDVWRADPLFPFKVWGGGMAFFGGISGVILAVIWAVRRYDLKFWQVTDALTFPAALGLGIGRVANFINGELVGSPTNGKWGVIFPKVDALPRHPSQLYEAASHFMLWAILLFLIKRRGDWARQKAGRLSLVFLSFYGFARFFTDFFRTDETYFGPFSSGQWASLAVGLIGIGFLCFRVGQTQRSVP